MCSDSCSRHALCRCQRPAGCREVGPRRHARPRRLRQAMPPHLSARPRGHRRCGLLDEGLDVLHDAGALGVAELLLVGRRWMVVKANDMPMAATTHAETAKYLKMPGVFHAGRACPAGSSPDRPRCRRRRGRSQCQCPSRRTPPSPSTKTPPSGSRSPMRLKLQMIARGGRHRCRSERLAGHLLQLLPSSCDQRSSGSAAGARRARRGRRRVGLRRVWVGVEVCA